MLSTFAYIYEALGIVSNEEDGLRQKPLVLSNLYININSRPILIRLSIVARPILAFLLKGSRFIDPIDGKAVCFTLWIWNTTKQRVVTKHSFLERHRLLWLYLKTKRIFFTAQKVLHFAPEQEFKRFKNNRI